MASRQTQIFSALCAAPRIRRLAAAAVAASTLLAGIQASPAQAYPRPGVTQRVTVASDGSEAMAAPGNHPATANSTQPAVSGDGRFVAFSSRAPNLAAGDSNDVNDVFVHDRIAGTTQRVSVSSDGVQADAQSVLPTISEDGRFVSFASEATNLVEVDTNDRWDVFVHDRVAGTTQQVSVASDGTQANGNSLAVSAMTPDGSLIAFSSLASNLVTGDTNAKQDIFVHDRDAGTTERVSVRSGGAQTNESSWAPAISADGTFVAFYSAASNLVPGDTDELEDVYVHDRAAGVTELVSVGIDGTNGTNPNTGLSNDKRPTISADGRFVAFASNAHDLVPADTNSRWDAFVHDRATGVTERVSVASDGTQGNGNVAQSAMSADGRFVVFNSLASNLVPDDTNAGSDVFVHDRATGATERVSLASDGTQAQGNSLGVVAISGDSRVVSFGSAVSNLVPGDTNGATDIFARDRGAPLDVVGPLSMESIANGVRVSGSATVSGSTLTDASDPDDDGNSVGPHTAADLGAELTAARVVYRPEPEDVLVRWRLASFPLTDPPQGRIVAAFPGVMYGLAFEADGTRFEVRGFRAAPTTMSSPLPRAALYRCAATCVEEATLTGSFGSVGNEVWISVPMDALGPESDQLSSMRAFTTVGEAAVGGVQELDDVDLPDAGIPAIRVELGVAPAATPEDEVVFGHLAELAEGQFGGDVPTGDLSAGAYRAWARSCLGDTCGPATSADLSL